MNAAVLCRLKTVTQGDQVQVISFVGRLVISIETEIGMVYILAFKCTRRIDQPELECKIPVGSDILGMQYVDHLLLLGTPQVSSLRERTGGGIEAGIIRLKRIYIERMKAGIPSGTHNGIEKK